MSRFGKIEWSDPQYERDHLRFLTFQSPALGGRGDVAVFVPPGCADQPDLPLVTLMHGVYCSHWSWAMKGGAHLTALEMMAAGEIPPMVIAMPSDGLWAEGSAYLPHEEADYEKWIVRDVANCVVENVGVLGGDSPLFIAGLSMGGYGALRLGAKYPDRFKGISAHSSVTRIQDIERLITPRPLPFQLQPAEEWDILYWMRQNRDSIPPLRFDCGLEDGLLDGNRALHRALRKMGIEHRYQEFPGEHSWAYWSRHLRKTLSFFGKLYSS